MSKIKYQLVKIVVNRSGELIRFSADTDRNYKRVTGLFVSMPTQLALTGSSLELSIADIEIFPEGFEAKLLSTGENVAPDDRFYTIESEAKGNRIDGKFIDGGNAEKYPYKAFLYLKHEDKF